MDWKCINRFFTLHSKCNDTRQRQPQHLIGQTFFFSILTIDLLFNVTPMQKSSGYNTTLNVIFISLLLRNDSSYMSKILQQLDQFLLLHTLTSNSKNNQMIVILHSQGSYYFKLTKSYHFL